MIVEELFLKANFLVNPIINPMLKSKSILKNEIIKRAQNGVYFITTEEHANKVIEESLIESEEPILSYGLKKSVFYAGIPEFPISCFDLKLPKTMSTIKLKLPYETLALFEIEMFQNAYKLFYPNLLIEPFDIKIVYLGLAIHDDKICYQEITKEEYENYELRASKTTIKNVQKQMAKEIKEMVSKLKKEIRNKAKKEK